MSSTLTLGERSKSEERARKASVVRDARYLARSNPRFEPVYQALHNGQWRDFGRASVKTLGFEAPPTYEEVRQRITEVGALCPSRALKKIVMQFKEQGDVCYMVTRDKLFRGTYHMVTELPLQMPTPAFYLETDVVFMLKKR